ncbi:MAG: zinc-binding dehydrogenase [Dysgonamonadaceae bacterium]|nr:zinc-binding dehydrogenase [Dysgonamonadaceae bacterium]MDD4727840.1 zinc-binding dehydrogenase [Dysgonamonadaceae bacterium]
MKTRAVRLYGKKDLRLEEFNLPPIKDNEILAKVVSDSLCMSSYKASSQGTDHKRIPDDVSENPIIVGHEFAGELIEIGAKWQHKFKAGEKFSIQPALNYKDGPVGILSAPGYSYPYIGGNATYVIIPNEVMEQDCLLPFHGKGYYPASLAEPLSCVIGTMHANYHRTPGSYVFKMGIIDGGNMAILAGVGPMGLAAINYVLHREDRRPSLLVVTDIDQTRLDRAASLYTVEFAASRGIDLRYINTSTMKDANKELRDITNGKGYDDVFVFAPVRQVVEQGDSILGFDGCLNFFAGPNDPNFKAELNFYNVHYAYTHIVGTSGGNNEDMLQALEMMSKGLDPAGLITHIGGLNAVANATNNLPKIPGGKKLIYNHITMPLTPITEFAKLGETKEVFKKLAEICDNNKGLWSVEAETYLLENSDKLH